MRSYVFANPQQTVVLRSDGASIPWPLQGYAVDLWLQDGSPTPTAYAAPAATTLDVDKFMLQRLASGFVDTGVGNTGKTWQCDDRSVGRWTALGATAGMATMTAPPPGTPLGPFQLISSDNTLVSLTATQTYALVQRMLAWVTSTVLYGRIMKNNILAGTPPADITAGWP